MASVGSPPFFETAESLQQAIDAYLTDTDILVKTITGLCYKLGFESRQSFYDYEKKPQFSYTIKRARLFIESQYEERLFSNSNAGAIFGLKNFGWTDKQEIEQKTEHSGSIGFTGIEIIKPDAKDPQV
jgi:hypothetical protein